MKKKKEQRLDLDNEWEAFLKTERAQAYGRALQEWMEQSLGLNAVKRPKSLKALVKKELKNVK